MTLKQLSVFLENKPGRLREFCALLADNGVNIITMSLADTEQFGIVRLIVKNYEETKQLIEEKGFVANIADVLAVEVPDVPGGLSSVLSLGEVSVEYMYPFTIKSGETAILLFRFDDMDRAVAVFKKADLNVLDSAELYKRAEG